MASFQSVADQTPSSCSTQLSESFIKKIELCKNGTIDKEFNWIFVDLLEGRSALDIANKALEFSDYDGDCLTSATHGLFDAFVSYKNESIIDSDDAAYLSNRAGPIGYYNIEESDGVTKMEIFSVRDIIRELDGEGFFVWLKLMGESNEFEDEFEDEFGDEFEEEFED